MSLESTEGHGEQGQSGQRRRLLDDPLSIRALAHPLRLELQSIVGRTGKITAADAARELGISHALASHHLRQLAKYGFVEQTEGADARAHGASSTPPTARRASTSEPAVLRRWPYSSRSPRSERSRI
jgi:DNA-binding MarR family transcriptional regulator